MVAVSAVVNQKKASHSISGVDMPALLAAGLEVFNLADKNSDGTLSKREMKNAITGSEKLCALFGFKNGRLKHFSEWFVSVDTDHDGTLTLAELDDWLLHHASHDSLAQWRDSDTTMSEVDDEFC